ncbi:Alpha/beta hydrolase [Mycobacteroides abscessus subsp. abscessus]|nr:Alpha/beta hydrolase [Mycobacteroides abscessus subsp. abscessus]
MAWEDEWEQPYNSRATIDADHYFQNPGARQEQADTIAEWASKRW